MFLAQYDFALTYKAGKDNLVADAFSRLPIVDDHKAATPMEYIKLVEVVDLDDISFQTIKKFAMEDETLNQLLNNIRFGWNQKDVRLSEYNCDKSDLSLYDNVIM